MSASRHAMWATSAGAGMPVVLIHGAFSDYRSWELQQIAYGRAYRAIALSLRGFYPDALPASELFSAEGHVEDLGYVLAKLGEPAHLIGHSRGGRIALHVAARFPNRVRSLVLAEPGGTLAPDFLPAAAKAAMGIAGPDVRHEAQRLIDAGQADQGLRLYVDSGHGEGTWDRTPELFRRVAMANARTIASMIADASAQISREIAQRVAVPTLFVAGSASAPLFGHIIDTLKASMPDARRVTIDGATHFLNLTHQAEFDRAVLRFLEEA
jgi:pimeloyl-ACP methyl ester carboxylesterase